MVAAVPLTIFSCSSSGSIGHAHGLFHVNTRGRVVHSMEGLFSKTSYERC